MNSCIPTFPENTGMDMQKKKVKNNHRYKGFKYIRKLTMRLMRSIKIYEENMGTLSIQS